MAKDYTQQDDPITKDTQKSIDTRQGKGSKVVSMHSPFVKVKVLVKNSSFSVYQNKPLIFFKENL
jgi:hypothetical protein